VEVGGPVDVVGHDWGGSLALALAGARPDLVSRLVVANAPFRTVPARALHIPLFALPVAPELLFRLGGRRVVRLMLGLGWRADTPLDPETQAEYEAAYAHADQVRAMLGYYRAAARPRLVAALRREKPAGALRVSADKMLVLWGARDPVLPISTGESVVSDLGPECVMVTVPGAGHFVIEEAPEVVAEVLVDFLSDAVDGVAPPEGPEQHRVVEPDPPRVEQAPTVGLVPVGAANEDTEPAPAEPAARKAPVKKAAKAKGPVKKATAAKAPVKKAAKAKAPVKKASSRSAPTSGAAAERSAAARRRPRGPAGGAGPEVPPSPAPG
jgi:hypothetical protein